MMIEYGPLEGSVPQEISSLSQIQQVKLRNNAFRAKLDMSGNISRQLQLIDLDNGISSVTVGSEYKSTLLLIGNPVCTTRSSSLRSLTPRAWSQICTSELRLCLPL